MNKKFTTSQITLLGLMVAILLLMAYTPLGYLNIGPLAISFNMIPVAISAITMGPVGGAVAGAVFGLTSFGQCIGIGGLSGMGLLYLLSTLRLLLSRDFFQDWLMVFSWVIFSVAFAKKQKIFMFPVQLPAFCLHF